MKKNDPHLDTGEYEPKKYWEARAKHSANDLYRAVCAYGYSRTENWAADRVQSYVLSRFLQELNIGKAKVLELGCGAGRWAPRFQKAGANYTGVDISEGMLALARNRTPSANFEHLTASKLPFDDDSFDLVFTVTVLHHNPYERQDELIDELLRVTKPGGFILLLEDIVSSDRRQISFNMFPRPIEDWIAAVKREERAEFIGIRLLRYWIIRDFVLRLLGKIFGQRSNERADIISANPRWLQVLRDLLSRADGLVDPFLTHVVTEKFAVSAAMLFRRYGGAQNDADALADSAR